MSIILGTILALLALCIIGWIAWIEKKIEDDEKKKRMKFPVRLE